MLTKLENKKWMQLALCLVLTPVLAANQSSQEEVEEGTVLPEQLKQQEDDDSDEEAAEHESAYGIIGVSGGYSSARTLQGTGQPVTEPGTPYLIGEFGGAGAIAPNLELGLSALVRWSQTSGAALSLAPVSYGASFRLVGNLYTQDAVKMYAGSLLRVERESVQFPGGSSAPGTALNLGGLVGIARAFGPVEVALVGKLMYCLGSDHGGHHGDMSLISGVHPEELAKIQEQYVKNMSSHLNAIRTAARKSPMNAGKKSDQIINSLFQSLPDVTISQIRNALARSSEPHRQGAAVAQTKSGNKISAAVARKALMSRCVIQQLLRDQPAIIAMVEGIHAQSSDQSGLSTDSRLRQAFLELRDAIDEAPLSVVVSSRAQSALVQVLACFRAELGVEVRINPAALVASKL